MNPAFWDRITQRYSWRHYTGALIWSLLVRVNVNALSGLGPLLKTVGFVLMPDNINMQPLLCSHHSMRCLRNASTGTDVDVVINSRRRTSISSAFQRVSNIEKKVG